MADPSGVYFRERNPQIAPPSTLTNAVIAALLVTERGPLEPTLCRTSKEFVDLFGGPTEDNADSYLPAMQCWDNGCKLMIVQRVVHHTTPTDPLTATLWGVYLHGEAGRILTRDVGRVGFLAREILDRVPGLLEG